MTAKILVAYATKYGSTKETAERIAQVLTEKSFSVDLSACREVKSLAGYQAVVIGAPLYAGSLLTDSVKFINRFREDMERIPAALFVLGPLNDSQQEIRGVQAQMAANRKKFPAFRPVEEKIFVGSLDLEKLRFPDSLIKMYRPAKNHPMKSSDNRNWKAVETWADSLPGALQIKTD